MMMMLMVRKKVCRLKENSERIASEANVCGRVISRITSKLLERLRMLRIAMKARMGRWSGFGRCWHRNNKTEESTQSFANIKENVGPAAGDCPLIVLFTSNQSLFLLRAGFKMAQVSREEVFHLQYYANESDRKQLSNKLYEMQRLSNECI